MLIHCIHDKNYITDNYYNVFLILVVHKEYSEYRSTKCNNKQNYIRLTLILHFESLKLLLHILQINNFSIRIKYTNSKYTQSKSFSIYFLLTS